MTDFHPLSRMQNILYVEDDIDFREALSLYLESHFSNVHRTSTIEDAEAAIKKESFDVIILDKWIGNKSTLSLIPKISSNNRDTVIVLLTGEHDFSRSLQTLELGADEYIVKPLIQRLNPEHQETQKFFDEVYFRLLRGKERQSLKRKNEILHRQIEATPPNQLIGRSSFIESLRSHVVNCKNLPGPVLITGELGTGKTLIARLIHKTHGESLPFITLDSFATLPEQIESVLFGHPKGGILGFFESYPGLLQHAHGGYLLIKEIANLPIVTQEKLTKVLQSGVCSRVGECEEFQSKFRLIATSRNNLKDLSENNLFSTELFKLINSNHIRLESLRSRVEDIMDLATHYLLRKYGINYEFSKEVQSYLESLPYAGNVKELRLLIDTAVLKAQFKETFQLLPEYFDLDSSSTRNKLTPKSIKDITPENFENAVNWAEKHYLEASLKLFSNSKVAVQEALRLSRGTLYNKIKFHQISKGTYND